jgi:hypothetical protein
MSIETNRGMTDASDGSRDEQESVLKVPVSAASRWHRPVMRVIPIRMTLQSSGLSFDGATLADFPTPT